MTRAVLAGDLKPGDLILWDGERAVVKHADKYRTAMLAGVQVELMVVSPSPVNPWFIATGCVNAGDTVFLA